MKIIKVNCQSCLWRKSTYCEPETGYSYSCYFENKHRGYIARGFVCDLPDTPPDFCLLEDAKDSVDRMEYKEVFYVQCAKTAELRRKYLKLKKEHAVLVKCFDALQDEFLQMLDKIVDGHKP